jgi:hypothetical protein
MKTKCETIDDMIELANDISAFIRSNKSSIGEGTLSTLRNAAMYVLNHAKHINENDADTINLLYKNITAIE